MTVTVDTRGATMVVTIDRPEARNALDPETCARLVEGPEAAEAADQVRSLIITGARDNPFCAGMDLKALRREPMP